MLGVLLLAGCDRGGHPGNIGKSAPQFVMSDGTHTVDLSKLRGRVVVLNLWATWCAPCIEELPSLLALQKKMPDLAVVAVSMDEDPDVYKRFLVEHHVDLLTLRDEEQKVNALYGTVQIPETYIIDKQGVLRRKFIGAQDWTSNEITGYLKKM
ncbi:MAG TPA: TlpA disulfide reductase family protein [Edaphobacter sp.]|jgi:cytochrome c biogenesis protein CcmG, thiol:disulfide interchange protein DsbE|nr:TlpA disulfide reductase family protein [Edaphobacter sp.]